MNAPNDDDKVGAYGYGFDVTAGLEFNFKALYIGLEVVNDFVFLRDYFRDISGVRTQLIDGGFSYQPSVMLGFGFHL